MKEGEFVDEMYLLYRGWTKLVKYGSISNVYVKKNIGAIINSVDGQVIRIIDKTEIDEILVQWEHVLSVNGLMK